MSASKRHLDLSRTLILASGAYSSKNSGIKIYGEGAALVHYGQRSKRQCELSLVDISQIKNADVLDDLYFVEPDFMIFHKNVELWNKRETKLAGYPDLVVEIWSDSNTQLDREEKFLIYSNSGGNTEHWYIEQDENEINCYVGEKQITQQNLKDVLRTQNGLEFDLRNLAL